MRNRLPIVYLVDSAGVNLPYQDGIFPGQYGAGPHLLLQLADAAQAAHSADRRGDGAVHRRRRVPAGAERRHHHGGRRQLHGPGRAQPGEGRHRPGRSMPNRWAARACTPPSAAWRITWPRTTPIAWRASASASASCPRRAAPRRRCAPRRAIPPSLYGVLPADHRLPYDIEEVIFRIFDAGDYCEFQPEYAPEMLCANARLCGPSGGHHRQPPRIPEGRGAAAHRRHRLYRIGAQGGVLRGDRRAAGPCR